MTTRYNDYSSKMPDLDFSYDDEYYPNDDELPDPQKNPILVGARVPIQKVGVGPVELPLKILQRDGELQEVYAKASLYGSLDDPNQKGLNFSRFYSLMHESLNNHISVDALKTILQLMREKQGTKNAFCKLRFKYKWFQYSLRTREDLPDDAPDHKVFKVVQGKKIAHTKKKSHIFYDCELEGQMLGDEYKFYLTVKYLYGSLCPCSFELSRQATVVRGKAASGHAQRSVATIKVEIDHNNPIWIEDIVEMARAQIPTECQIFLRRRDEQSLGELFAAGGMLFTEDSSRILYEGLDQLFNQQKILDFSVVTVHGESIHPYDAIAIINKGLPNGLR